MTEICNISNNDFYTRPPILSLTFGDDDTLITGNANAAVRLWKISTREEIRVLKGHSKEISSIAFSRDKKIVVTGSADATAKLWDTLQQPQAIRLNEQDPKVSSIAFSPGIKFSPWHFRPTER